MSKDFDFYLKNADKFDFCGQEITVISDVNGYSAKDAFILWDSQGKCVPCKEADTLKKVITAKKSINMHIQMWVEGYDDCLQGVKAYLNELIEPPLWVEKSFRHQLAKRVLAVKGN